jgi:hypothetical protein
LNQFNFSEIINENNLKLSTVFKKISPNFDDVSEYDDIQIDYLDGDRTVKKVKHEKISDSQK